MKRNIMGLLAALLVGNVNAVTLSGIDPSLEFFEVRLDPIESGLILSGDFETTFLRYDAFDITSQVEVTGFQLSASIGSFSNDAIVDRAFEILVFDTQGFIWANEASILGDNTFLVSNSSRAIIDPPGVTGNGFLDEFISQGSVIEFQLVVDTQNPDRVFFDRQNTELLLFARNPNFQGVIPEPSSALLLGLAALGTLRRRR